MCILTAVNLSFIDFNDVHRFLAASASMQSSCRHRLNEGEDVVLRARIWPTFVGDARKGDPIKQMGDLAVFSENDLRPLPSVQHPLLPVG